ncbi:hypothetical protein TRIUR3_26537 [Triticum urartu]|uniref:Uncharacterized protein n=1 Tax=Triticum urartu TaxID=4572 RepID=M7ZAT9_TRIUA|nr:hypothetical protein TRIUR3_26537 [Triticum urartu]
MEAGVVTCCVRCWNQHASELQPASGAAMSGGAHNYERKGEMLPTAIRNAGIGSVESSNRWRHMLQAAMWGWWNQRVLEPMRKDASTASLGAATGNEGCFHGEEQRAATGIRRVAAAGGVASSHDWQRGRCCVPAGDGEEATMVSAWGD